MKKGIGTPRIYMRRGLTAVACLAAVSLFGASLPLDQAAKLYRHTDHEASLKILLGLPEKDAPVFDLIGRNYFMLGNFKKASEFYEKPVIADPTNSEFEHWLE